MECASKIMFEIFRLLIDTLPNSYGCLQKCSIPKKELHQYARPYIFINKWIIVLHSNTSKIKLMDATEILQLISIEAQGGKSIPF